MRRINFVAKTRDPERSMPLAKPLTEGAIPLDNQGRRSWATLNDAQIIQYAKSYMKEKCIRRKHELEDADLGLYVILRKRNLLVKIWTEQKQTKRKNWASMSDDQIIQYAKSHIKENGISRMVELYKTKGGIYDALRKRHLLDKIGIEKKIREWAFLTDGQLVQYVKAILKEKGIKTKTELKKTDGSLYNKLRRRNLLGKIDFEKNLSSWASLSDTMLVQYTKSFMKEKGITRITELENAAAGLYQALGKRNLIDKLGIEKKRGKWILFSDDQLIKHVSSLMKDAGITGRAELQKADPALYQVLQKRNLLDMIEFEKKQRKKRNWASMNDDQIIQHTISFMNDNGIAGKGELQKRDKGLYEKLRVRNLLERIVFQERLRKQRDWASMTDDQIIMYTGSYIKDKNIAGRTKLQVEDSGLYIVLLRRNLLDRVFPQSEKKSESELLSQLKDAVELYLGKGEK